jgi:hypothetical protein
MPMLSRPKDTSFNLVRWWVSVAVYSIDDPDQNPFQSGGHATCEISRLQVFAFDHKITPQCQDIRSSPPLAE